MKKFKSTLSLVLVVMFAACFAMNSIAVNAAGKTATKKATTAKAVKEAAKPTVKPAAKKQAAKVDPQAETEKVYNSYIADAKWLSANLNSKSLVLLDARGPETFAKGHIKGAIAVKWQQFANVNGKPGDKNWGLPLGAQELSKKFADLGVDATKTIVVYADTKNGWGEDGRIVWMLRMLGLNNAKMLNGGYNYWTDKGYATTTDESVAPVATKFTAKALDESYMATTDWLSANLSKVKILDSRNKDEYEGATKYGEARGGHIPGAVNFNFTNTLNADGTFKSFADLQKTFAAAGLKKDDAIATYCTAGIRSAHLSLALRMAGYSKAQNYASSFYEWSGNSNLKVEK